MYIIPLLTAFVFAFLFYMMHKDIFYPGCFFNGIWLLVLLFDAINIAGLFRPESNIYIILTIGIIFYNIGFLLLHFGKRKRVEKSAEICAINADVRRTNKRFLAVQIIVSVFLLVLLSRMLVYILDGNWYIVRRIYTSGTYEDGSAFMSTFERMLYISYGIFPFAYANFIVGTVAALDGAIKKKYYLVSFINMAVITLITGGRLSVFYMLIVFLVIYSRIKRKTGAAPISAAKRNLLILAAVVFAFVNIALRTNDGETDFLGGGITYFVGGIHIFDEALQNPHTFGLTDRTFGVMTFRGFFEIINIFLYYLSGRTVPLLSSVFANNLFDNAIYIGAGIKFNAFPTLFYYHFRDMGYLGLAVFPLIISGIANAVYDAGKRKASYMNICLLAEAIYFISMSPCWSIFIQSEVWFRLLYIALLIRFYGFGKREVGARI